MSGGDIFAIAAGVVGLAWMWLIAHANNEEDDVVDLGPVGPVDVETGRSPVDPFEGIPSYAEVAQTLAPDIRAAIEERLPCVGGGEHDWDEEVVEISTWGERSTRKLRTRWCRRCELSTPNPSYDGGIKHGTSAGFRAHTAKGEIPCKPCLDAEYRWAKGVASETRSDRDEWRGRLQRFEEQRSRLDRLGGRLGKLEARIVCASCGEPGPHAHIKTADGTIIA